MHTQEIGKSDMKLVLGWAHLRILGYWQIRRDEIYPSSHDLVTGGFDYFSLKREKEKWDKTLTRETHWRRGRGKRRQTRGLRRGPTTAAGARDPVCAHLSPVWAGVVPSSHEGRGPWKPAIVLISGDMIMNKSLPSQGQTSCSLWRQTDMHAKPNTHKSELKKRHISEQYTTTSCPAEKSYMTHQRQGYSLLKDTTGIFPEVFIRWKYEWWPSLNQLRVISNKISGIINHRNKGPEGTVRFNFFIDEK